MSAPRFSPAKALWLLAHLLPWALLGAASASPSALAVFAIASGLSLCLGHSVGMHRGLIHRSYRARRPLRLALAWLGCLAGLGGPLSLLAYHEQRDHAQNQPVCPPWLRNGRPLLHDAYEQLLCALPGPEGFSPVGDPEWEADPALQALERAWRWQNLPLALGLGAIGGWGWVIWGVCARVSVGILGFWFVNWLAHNHGAQRWQLPGVAASGHNLLLLGALSFGEGWHNNHHRYPGSARMGLAWYELDLGYLAIRAFERLGWVSEVQVAPPVEQDSPFRPLISYNVDV
ncbi:MAG: acyl-CoA desaturase [Alphaproteobacteria bacterium]|nr:acyl-CoA desaturase [Alphaproteobacteria bacterium]